MDVEDNFAILGSLKFECLEKKQEAAFASSLPRYTESSVYEQEKRQTTIKEKVVTIKVQVAREDFPSVAGDVEISYLPSAAQGAWRYFCKYDSEQIKSMHFTITVFFLCTIRRFGAF